MHRDAAHTYTRGEMGTDRRIPGTGRRGLGGNDGDHGGPGAELADFRLPASTGQTLSKAAFLYKVPLVVAFMPDLDGDDEAIRLEAYNERLKDFGSLPSQVLAEAKATASKVRWKAEDLGIRFPILADPTGGFASDCGALGPERSFRSVTLIADRQGKIRHRLENEVPNDEADTAYTFIAWSDPQ